MEKAIQSSRHSFIAEHRGGPLTRENHHQLIRWAAQCAEHVIYLIDNDIDQRLLYALEVAKRWEIDQVKTGVAMKASLGAHAAAREAKNPVSKAVAHSVGQVVATAHMADHSLGAAFYALKAIKLARKDIAKEKEWQKGKLNELPSELQEIVHDMWLKKELDKRIIKDR
jgi:hypothetical protein